MVNTASTGVSPGAAAVPSPCLWTYRGANTGVTSSYLAADTDNQGDDADSLGAHARR
jgi:phage-related protein